MTSRKRSKSRQRQRPFSQTFNRALQLHMQGRIAEAETAYRRLIAANPQNARLFHLLGRLLHQQNKINEAIKYIRQALAIHPGDRQALNDLGLLYLEAGDLQEAFICFSGLLKFEPENTQAANNLAVVLKQQNRLEEAVTVLTKAVSLDPDNADMYCNLGNTLKRLHDWHGASAAYQQALTINPHMLDVYPNLAAVLRRLDKLDEAADIFAQWLTHEPDNKIARHLHAAVSDYTPPAQATPGYVRDVFDEFAETYDQHLKKLDYRGPQLIAEALQSNFPYAEAKFSILDIGCGTGLCGKILKPFARRLVGVDLAAKMLEQAQQLNIYDELVEMDLVTFLHSHPSLFDVIVSGDTFGYFGDLQPVLAAVRHALRDDGVLVCTFETGEDENIPPSGYHLMKSGRYRHARDYLQSSLSNNGFAACNFTPGILRMEAGQPVECLVVQAMAQTRE